MYLNVERIKGNLGKCTYLRGKIAKLLPTQTFQNKGGPNTEKVQEGIKYAIRVIFSAGPKGIN